MFVFDSKMLSSQVLYKYVCDVLFQGQAFQLSITQKQVIIFSIYFQYYTFDSLSRKEGSSAVPG